MRFLIFCFFCRRYIIIEQWPLIDGWKSSQKLNFKHVLKEAACAHNMVYITVDDPSKVRRTTLFQ